jgi:hypothetical protein
MPEIDGASMLRALARENTLRVFAAVVDATGTGAPQRSGSTISVGWTTATGVSRQTGLSDTAVVAALTELTEAHLIVASPEGHRWYTDFGALSRAVASLPS